MNDDERSALLQTVQAQTFSDLEIVTADESWNAAAEKAQGDYLAFADAGQRWMPRKLEKQTLMLRQNPDVSWCYCDAWLSGTQIRWSETTRLPGGNILRPLLLKNFIPPGSVLMRRDVFAALGGFDESGVYLGSEEWELWIRLAAIHLVGVIHEPLISVPQAAAPDAKRQQSMKRVVESAVARHQDRLKDLRSESLAEICICAGNAHLKANQRHQARLNFEEALTHSPLRSDAYLSWVSSFLSSEAQQQIRDLHNLGRQLQKTEKGKSAEKIGA
jgi:hypothetical protein